MTDTYIELNKAWNAEVEKDNPDPETIGRIYLAMEQEKKIDKAYRDHMEQCFFDDPTGQDYD